VLVTRPSLSLPMTFGVIGGGLTHVVLLLFVPFEWRKHEFFFSK
jgi:hypothetical protein